MHPVCLMIMSYTFLLKNLGALDLGGPGPNGPVVDPPLGYGRGTP